METPPKSSFKINIFALPSQTAIIFGLIVLVLLGTVFAGSIGPSPIPVYILALGLLLLPLRAFLARPERDSSHYNQSLTGDDLTGLQQAIETSAKEIGLRRTPKLVVSKDRKSKQPYVFGTFRHWYIAFSYEAAQDLQADFENPDSAPVAQAKLIHELYHFKTGDYWQMGYARELLRTVFLFTTWAACFFCGFTLFLMVAAPDFLEFDFSEMISQVDGLTPEMQQLFIQIMPSSAEMEEVRQKAASINLSLVLNFAISATLPFAIMGGALWGLYWPKLWRARELYADAGVMQVQGKSKPFLSALTQIPLPLLKTYSLLTGVERPFSQGRRFSDKVERLWSTLKGLVKRHPSAAQRIVCARNPARVFDSWIDTAILVGSVTLLLDILLSSSLTLLYVGNWPMHFSTLTVLIIVSLSFVPSLVQGRSVWSDILKITTCVMGLRLAWLLLTITLMVILVTISPGFFSEMLATAVANVAHFAGYSDELGFDDSVGFIVEASILNLTQVFIIAFVAVISLVVVVLLLRRLLTWYGYPQADNKLMKVAYLIIGGLALFLGLTVLPVITTILLRPEDLFNLSGIIIGGIGLTVTIVGLYVFLRNDQRYAQRCPGCGSVVPGSYQLGKRCHDPHCNELLHPWMLVEYEL